MVPFAPPGHPLAPPPEPTWVTRFDAFTPFHAAAVGACVAVIVAWCFAGRRLRSLDARTGGSREAAFRWATAGLCLSWQGYATVWRLLPEHFDPSESWPLHLCRIVGVVAPIGLLTRNRWCRSIGYFWGIGLSTQGLLTPMWHEGAGTMAFWLYWVGHTIIVGIGVYDIAVHRYRPSVREWMFASVTGLAFAGVVIAANLVMGTNYSYLGPGEYAAASVVDLVAPWPARPAVLIVLALGAFSVMYLVSTRRVPGPAREASRAPVAEAS